MRSHTSERQSGFTLVELLVVIGIIAVLISILLPSLAKARAVASAISCAARMRQLSNAVQMYANDNRGYCPPVVAQGANTAWPQRPSIFPAGGLGFLHKYLTAGTLGRSNTISVETSGNSARLYTCPELENGVNQAVSCYSYKYNGYVGDWGVSGSWDAKPMSMGKIRQPSSVALFLEFSTVQGALGANQRFYRDTPSNEHWLGQAEQLYLHGEKRPGGQWKGWWNNAPYYNRRTGVTNVAFADGSVRGVAVDQKSSPFKIEPDMIIDPRYPQASW